MNKHDRLSYKRKVHRANRYKRKQSRKVIRFNKDVYNDIIPVRDVIVLPEYRI